MQLFDGETLLSVGPLRRIEGEKGGAVCYQWEIDGRTVQLQAADLLSQTRFRRACLEQIGFIPPKVSGPDWTITVNGALVNGMEE